MEEVKLCVSDGSSDKRSQTLSGERENSDQGTETKTADDALKSKKKPKKTGCAEGKRGSVKGCKA